MNFLIHTTYVIPACTGKVYKHLLTNLTLPRQPSAQNSYPNHLPQPNKPSMPRNCKQQRQKEGIGENGSDVYFKNSPPGYITRRIFKLKKQKMFSILLVLLCLGTTNANCVRSDALLLARLNTLCASLGGSSSNCPAGNATAEHDWSCSTRKITRQTRTNYFTCTFSHKQAKSGRLHEQSAERIGIT